MEEKSQGLINSVAAGNIVNQEESTGSESDTSQGEQDQNAQVQESYHSLEGFVAKAQNSNVNLNITITPYDNRIIIPKIGKNIPLVEVQQPKVSGIAELNDIFMDELKK